MRRSTSSVLAVAALAAAPALAAVPADTLYGSGDSALVVLDQGDGSMTPLAPQPIPFQGLAFDSTGRLFATGCPADPPCRWGSETLLLELDPATGAILDSIGPVTDLEGLHPAILTLAVQPGTNALYGFGYLGHSYTRVWRIDPETAAATPIASEVPAGCEPPVCSRYLGFEFAPDGTLYHAALYPSGSVLFSLDPATGADLGSVLVDPPLLRPPGFRGPSLARRSDGTLFAVLVVYVDRCNPCPPPLSFLSTIDPPTGARTEVGRNPGASSDLAFSPIVVSPVEIDIEPGNDVNALNPMGRGVVAVAVLGSEDFDVREIDVTTLAFGPGGAPIAHRNGPHFRDVDHDGITDVLAHYTSSDTGIAFGDLDACVTGERLDGTSFAGCDSITTLPPACGEGFGLALVLPLLIPLGRRARELVSSRPRQVSRCDSS